MSTSSFVLALFLVLTLTAATGPASGRSAPSDKAAVDRGRDSYQQHCAACHGKDGKGAGPAAPAMKTRPTDLTLMQQQNGAFFRAKIASAVRGTDLVVAHGAPGMMVWGALFRAEARGSEVAVDARIDDLIAFLETVQR